MIITMGVCSTCQNAASDPGRYPHCGSCTCCRRNGVMPLPQAGGCRCFCTGCLGAIAGIPNAQHCNGGNCR